MPTTNLTPALPRVRGLHHFAWRCRDREETGRFCEDLMGLTDGHIMESIDFFDPNGFRAELTTTAAPHAEMDAHALRAAKGASNV